MSLTVLSFDVITGKTFSKKETFGAFPLQVQGYGDLHDSLEGAMAQVEIEPVGPEGSHKSGQEVGNISYHIQGEKATLEKYCTLKLCFQLNLPLPPKKAQ